MNESSQVQSQTAPGRKSFFNFNFWSIDDKIFCTKFKKSIFKHWFFLYVSDDFSINDLKNMEIIIFKCLQK